MDDPPRNVDTNADTDVRFDRGSATGTSRWQKVVGIIGFVVVLWVGSQMLGAGAGRGGHSPGMDTPAENQEQEIDTEDGDGHAPGPPEGGH